MAALPEHSPLGASTAYRILACRGSANAARGCVDEESDHAALGTAAHLLGDRCLTNGQEPWEYVGYHIIAGKHLYAGDVPAEVADQAIPVDKDMADAVSKYVTAVNEWHPERNQGNAFIERRFHCPDIHPLFYGTSDFVFVDFANRTIHVWDYKHGAGIVVEAKDNPQLKYYAAGILEDLGMWNEVDTVVVHIAQPRAWHGDGPIRHWQLSTDDLDEWLFDVLVPAMIDAETSTDLVAGEHCRFCPARAYACPALVADMDELEKLMAKAEKSGVAKLTNEEVGRYLELFDRAKIVAKAAERTAYSRLQHGSDVPGRKLAPKKANREWKEGAEKALKKKFGQRAFDPPKLRTPAGIDALPEGESFTARWAYKPDTGLTVVKAEDARPAVNRNVKSLFKPQ